MKRAGIPASTHSVASGQATETQALAWLQRRGTRLIARNYRCRSGEIDLIVEDGTVLAFVEVRRRRHQQFGGAAASVTPAKQRRLAQAAQHFLAGRSELPPCRFDVICFDGAPPAKIRWIKNAFMLPL